MDMRTTIEGLAEEAERQLHDKTWEPTDADRALAAQAAVDLAAAVGPPDLQQALTPVERLEDLREALAVIAIATARIHGPLAWLLAAASTALAPILHWRALAAEAGHTFGTIEAGPEWYAEAEDAVRRLQAVLAVLGAP
ncbi:hypothetical protein [Streptomyces sp. NPDC005533]|uniref:hypothetical protein n=1 Tax=Streptomyces sp. NPDC005533 TaxID=3364723 RepID=UPI0036BF7588